MVKIGSVEEGCISIGPWGGQLGEPWSYKADIGCVTHVIIRHGGAIDSILFLSESIDGYTLESSEKFGGRGGNRTNKISIDGPVEHFTTLSMTFGDFEEQSVIKSLCFHTNLTQYGPFDSKSGTSASIPMEGGVFFGFHGRAGKYLNSIGIYVAPKISSFGQIGGHDSTPRRSMNRLVQRNPGPWGAQRGRQWDDSVFVAVLKQVILRTGGAVPEGNSMFLGIQFEYEQRDEKSFTSPWHGNFHGGQWRQIFIDNAVEHLTTISLTWGEFEGESAIRSLCFHTNLTEYGPFGLKEGTNSVTIPIKGGVIVGFHGRAGRLLNAIGFYVAQKIPSFCPIQDSDSVPTYIDQNMMSSTKLVVPRDPGPWGASGGKHWDDGVFSAIKKVYVSVVDAAHTENSTIHGVRFVYDIGDGKCFPSPWHGSYGTSGIRTEMIELDLDCSEVIVGIEGFYGPLIERENGFEALTSITMYTNKRKYGPYGREIGTHFSSMHSGGEVVGFFGRSGTHLNAIGVHMKYF